MARILRQRFRFRWKSHQYLFQWDSMSNQFFVSLVKSHNDTNNATIRSACSAWVQTGATYAGMTAAEFLTRSIGIRDIEWVGRG